MTPPILPPIGGWTGSTAPSGDSKYHKMRWAVLQLLCAGLVKNTAGLVNTVAKRRRSGYRITGWRACGGKYSSWHKQLCYM